MGRLNSCNHQKIRIHVSEIDLVSGITDELRQKHTLSSAIALTKCNKKKTLYPQDKCSYRVSVCSAYHLGEGNIKSQLKIICISLSVMVITLSCRGD